MRIGIVTPWFERGIAVISLAIHQALRGKHELFVLAQQRKEKPLGKEWKVPELFLASGRSFGFPLPWAQKLNLDLLIFNERHDCQRLMPIRRSGIKTLCLQEWESVNPNPKSIVLMNACFDGIIAPTPCSRNRFLQIGLKRVFFVPWGINLDLFYPQKKDPKASLLFFHSANYGGVAGRKCTSEVRRAFGMADTKSAHLLIALQRGCGDEVEGKIIYKRGTRIRSEMAILHRKADVLLLPSKWEGLGLTFLEALASGLAIVTTNAPPMSDYVRDGWNGFLCKTKMQKPISKIFVDQARIDMEDLTTKISMMCQEPERVRRMGLHSRQLAEEKYDWKTNGRILLKIVEEIC